MSAAPTTAGKRSVILVVDDDETVRSLLTRLLTKAGYVAQAVATCAEALAIAQAETVDLLISDIVLGSGGGDSVELVEQIRALQPNVGTLFVSGYAEPWSPPTQDSILAKPFTTEQLLARVEFLLS